MMSDFISPRRKLEVLPGGELLHHVESQHQLLGAIVQVELLLCKASQGICCIWSGVLEEYLKNFFNNIKTWRKNIFDADIVKAT